MRTHFMFHTLAFFIAVLTFSMPFGTLAQQHSWRVEAKIAAERDAQTDINKRCGLERAVCFLEPQGAALAV